MSELRKPPILASTRLGDLVLDFSNYRIISSKKQSKVEPRVMAVLEVLLRHNGEAVSRQMFMDEVLDGNALTDDALNRAISILRRELRAFGHEDLIQTIPKRGYRLDVPDDRVNDSTVVEPAVDVAADAPPARKGMNRFVKLAVAACALVVIGGVSFWAGGAFNPTPVEEAEQAHTINRINIRSALNDLTVRGMPVDIAVETLVRTQSFTGAIEEMDAQRDTVIATSTPDQYVSYLHQLGALAYDREIERATAVYREILNFKPDDTLALIQLSRLLNLSSETEAARSYLTRAQELGGQSDYERLSMEMLSAVLGDTDVAERVIRLRAVTSEAEAFGELEIWTRAETFLVNHEWLAASRDGGTPSTSEYEAWIVRLERVLETNQALGLQHDVVSTRATIALLRSVGGDKEAAITEYEAVLALEENLLRPKHLHVVLTNLANLHLAQGRLDEAAHYNDRALRSLRNANLNQDLTFNWYLASRIAEERGELEEACSYIAAAVQSFRSAEAPVFLREHEAELSCASREMTLATR